MGGECPGNLIRLSSIGNQTNPAELGLGFRDYGFGFHGSGSRVQQSSPVRDAREEVILLPPAEDPPYFSGFPYEATINPRCQLVSIPQRD